ncbi:MAG: caspase family protein [Spirochaetes bacterium]|nr:caspase family protein [Spirochaetota bacterium]
MSYRAVPLLFAVLLAGWLAAEEGRGPALRRSALFVGAHDGGPDREPLRHAHADAETLSRVFLELGGVATNDGELLLEPSALALLSKLDAVHRRLAEERGKAARSEFVFYYSGHSDEKGLLLGRSRIEYGELRRRIGELPADLRLVILDSCASGAFTRAKGGVKRRAFLSDPALSARGFAALTSSSPGELSMESDRLGGSFFTLALVAGLRGGADSRGAGRVNLDEAYQYAYRETVEKTAALGRAAQHPLFEVQLAGAGEVVLTDLRDHAATLVLEPALEGLVTVRSGVGRLVSQARKEKGQELAQALVPGNYAIRIDKSGEAWTADALLEGPARLRLGPPAFTRLSNRDPVRDPRAMRAVNTGGQLLLGSVAGGVGAAGGTFLFGLLGHALDPAAPIGIYSTLNAPVALGLLGFLAGDIVLSAVAVNGVGALGDHRAPPGAAFIGASVGTAVALPLILAIAYRKSGVELLPAVLPAFLPGLAATLAFQIGKKPLPFVGYVLPTGSGWQAGIVASY